MITHKTPASQRRSDTHGMAAGGSSSAGSSQSSADTQKPTAAARRPKGRAA